LSLQKLHNWIDSEELRGAVKSRTPSLCLNAVDISNIDWNIVTAIINMSQNNYYKRNGGFIVEDQRFLAEPGLFRIAQTQSALVSAFPPPTGDSTIHLYGSLSSDAETNGEHKDTADVFYLHGMGNTLVKTFNSDRASNNIRMQTGDILYIPRGIYHDTVPLGARFAFSIGLEYGNNWEKKEKMLNDSCLKSRERL
jgi:hypothetical protein